ncbi:hypothetical protein DPMN_027191 [Dreissena polymorpha]|uniref:Uncharacterized protein n=1 Tax=Dreissena polymorpha TaxID=45954 RepID=A0A9D4LWJ5_DREPO|nr:hypothetical protein DPMN_027191 [Dreissena polymorpha]
MESNSGAASAENIIEQICGCSRFPWRLPALIHATKTVVAFSVYASIIMTNKPQQAGDQVTSTLPDQSATQRCLVHRCRTRSAVS